MPQALKEHSAKASARSNSLHSERNRALHPTGAPNFTLVSHLEAGVTERAFDTKVAAAVALFEAIEGTRYLSLSNWHSREKVRVEENIIDGGRAAVQDVFTTTVLSYDPALDRQVFGVRHFLRRFEVLDASGARIKVEHLLVLGEENFAYAKLLRSYWYRRTPQYCGYGPVPRTRKHRGGSGSYMRHIETTAERRLNGSTVFEEGEVAPRAARLGHNLPSSYDDASRCVQRGWKSQHKGRKAWDRVRHGADSLNGDDA